MWMWTKRVLFMVAMLLALIGATMAFGSEAEKTALYVILNIVAILFALGNSFLYFRACGGKSVLLTLLLVVQIIDTGILMGLGADSQIIGIIGALFGFFVHAGSFVIDLIKNPEKAKAGLIKIAVALGFLCGIGYGVYMLFFNK